MKKYLLLLVSIFFLSTLAANAQKVVVKAGYNYNSISGKVTTQDIKNGRSGYQFGLAYQTESSRGFSFQPELVYKVAGIKFSDIKKLDLGYVEVPINVQWGPDLLVARPFIFAGPFAGFKVANFFRGEWTDTDMDAVRDGLKKAEWGLNVGLGLDIFKFQISGRYNWHFGKIADLDGLPTYDLLSNAPRTFEVSIGLKF